MKNTMIAPLNNAQLELLKLFSKPLTKTELDELKATLLNFLSKKLTAEVNEASKERGYSEKQIDNFRLEHNRRKAK